jgi:hypothetical protein
MCTSKLGDGCEIKHHAYDLAFEFNKRAELFVGVHNVTLSVAAVRICNPDRPPVGINR